MSLVIGAVSPDGGCLVTDSMVWRLRPDGFTERADVDVWGSKIGILGGVAYVRAGVDCRPYSGVDGTTFIERARMAYKALSPAPIAVPANLQASRPDGSPPTESDLKDFNGHDFCCIPTSWPLGSAEPVMGLLTDDRERWWSTAGGVCVSGTCRDFRPDLQDFRPTSLAQCQAVALEVALGFINWIAERDAENARGLPPGVALLPPAARPLHAVVVNREGWNRWQVL